jgi:hypothetical protein
MSSFDRERLRRRFTYQSLRGRLAYEQSLPRDALNHGEKFAEILRRDDEHFREYGSIGYRGISLAALHGEKVDEFVNRPGFGGGRMSPPPGPYYLRETPAETPVPFDNVATFESQESSGNEAPLIQSAAEAARRKNPWRMPLTDEVSYLHFRASTDFASTPRYGFIKSLDQVAGFQSHAILQRPFAPLDAERVPFADRDRLRWVAAAPRWRIVRLELVSLLKHATPRVYLSKNMPRMQDLSSQETRAPNPFEEAALAKLIAGEHEEIASKPNRIEMLGALRAFKECKQCHDVPHGALLGAFSYELVRDPPIKTEAAIGIMQ